MKHLLILLLLFSCKKANETVTLQIYFSEVQHANFNEPKRLYWYIVDEGKDNYYIATHTDLNRSVELLEFKQKKPR